MPPGKVSVAARVERCGVAKRSATVHIAVILASRRATRPRVHHRHQQQVRVAVVEFAGERLRAADAPAPSDRPNAVDQRGQHRAMLGRAGGIGRPWAMAHSMAHTEANRGRPARNWPAGLSTIAAFRLDAPSRGARRSSSVAQPPATDAPALDTVCRRRGVVVGLRTAVGSSASAPAMTLSTMAQRALRVIGPIWSAIRRARKRRRD
jgi:hypothetical protein